MPAGPSRRRFAPDQQRSPSASVNILRAVLASVTTDWVGSLGALVGPFIGVLGALWLYTKRRRDDDAAKTRDGFEALYLRLRAEVDANRRIVARSLETIQTVLRSQPEDQDANAPIHDERLYLAPLFAQSWDALTRTDAQRVIPRADLDRLFTYYTAVARANWLIERVQAFQFRLPILNEILATLREVQDPTGGGQVDLEALEKALAPGLADSR